MSGDVGQYLQSVRKRRGFTQRELAEASRVSLSFIRKLEQGERDDARMETLRRLAVALGCPLTTLLGPAPTPPVSRDGELWEPTRVAIAAMEPNENADSSGTLAGSLAAAVQLYHDNRYERLAQVLPRLIDEGRAAEPVIRSRILQLAGSVMVQTRQLRPARIALEQSVADAERTGNAVDSASAIVTLCWLMIVERQFDAVRELATRWADRIEPRLSVATEREISTWGWLLLRGSAAAIRDNRPDEADDMMRLAQAGAVVMKRDVGGYQDYWTRFGPATVAMKRVENAVVDDQPDLALRLAREVPAGLRPTSDNRNRHLLDVASAHLELRRPDTAFDVLRQLSIEAGPWLAEQRLARDLMGRLIAERRTLTAEMRHLADLIDLEY
ncbi:helix-turn-helix transcriptional regulator [Nocardia sp. NPDC052001]|uniref:helix-turn-helix domain-containing protein n=1 Tax=Nocardia sp. NPDC052001 TaxID=3154853 RepID=UPI003434CC62